MASQCIAPQQRHETNLKAVETPAPTHVVAPRTDVYENDDAIVLVADLPGIAEDGVTLTFEQRVLSVEAQAPVHQHEGYRLVYGEYEPSAFRRAFTVNTDIDRDNIAATMKNGVLTITLPKAAPTRVTKIAVHGE